MRCAVKALERTMCGAVLEAIIVDADKAVFDRRHDRRCGCEVRGCVDTCPKELAERDLKAARWLLRRLFEKEILR